MPAAKQQRRGMAGSKVKAPQQQQASSSISSFTRVSKSVRNANVKKELNPPTPKKAVKLEPITPASRKRKVVVSIEDDSSADERPVKVATSSIIKPTSSTITTTTTTTTTTTITTPPQPVKRGRGRPPKKHRPNPTPPKPEPTPRKRMRSPSPSDSDVSSIDAGLLFKKLRLGSSPSRYPTPLTTDTSVAGSDVESDASPTKSGELPEEVLSLITLHTAFLKALTLYYTHNGSNVPADLRVLCPNITRAWSKKKVTDEDVRVCLGVLSESSTSPNSNPFRLSNYGHGKICVEMDASHSLGPLDENKLNALFRANISSLWTKFRINGNKTPPMAASATAFINTLPKAPVTLCESVAKALPLVQKGHQRLEALKQSMAAKKQEKAKTSAGANPPKPTTTTTTTTTIAPASGAKISLLDRIRLKDLQKASMPAGLSPAQLERRAALQRAEEVAALLDMRSRSSADGCGGRVSFGMAELLGNIKDSLRMGISQPEAATCIRLLAAEIAPEWARVVPLAGREHVVLETARAPSKAEVTRRVQTILARGG